MKWISIMEQVPPQNTPVLFSGTTGMAGKFSRFIASGKYYPEHRPHSPYMDETNTPFTDAGYVVTHWSLDGKFP